MKNMILFLFVVILFFACSRNKASNEGNSKNNGSDVIIKPQFLGGDSLFISFIKNNMLLPEVVKRKKIKNEVWVRFWVMKDGTISRINILKLIDDCSECSSEAIRLVSIMPKWSAAYEVDPLGNKIIEVDTEIVRTIPFSYL